MLVMWLMLNLLMSTHQFMETGQLRMQNQSYINFYKKIELQPITDTAPLGLITTSKKIKTNPVSDK